MRRALIVIASVFYLLTATLAAASPQIQPLDMQGYGIWNVADGTASSDAATVGQLAAYVPAGTIFPTARMAVPTGFLACDGSAVSRTTYATLLNAIAPTATITTTSGSANISVGGSGSFPGTGTYVGAVIEGTGIPAGTTIITYAPPLVTMSANATASGTITARLFLYGRGDGSTTFNLPNLQQRFPLGRATSGTGALLGATGGTIDHTHSVPAHFHGVGAGSALTVSGTTSTNGAHSHGTNTRNTGQYAGGYGLTASPAWADRPLVVPNAGDTGIVTTTDGSHAHTFSATATGTIGLVTGGVNGNAAMTSGAANPPYQVVNFMIKY